MAAARRAAIAFHQMTDTQPLAAQMGGSYLAFGSRR